jgi:hypothetical protein
MFSRLSAILKIYTFFYFIIYVFSSVPDPDPPDQHVFGPLGSGSITQKYGSGSGSGSLVLSNKIVMKTLIPTVL